MKWASAVSESHTLQGAVEETVSQVLSDLGSGSPDLAFIFVSAHHSEQFARVPELVLERLGARMLLGCSAGGVIGGGHEVELRPGFSLTAAHLPEVELVPFHLEDNDLPDMDASPRAWEEVVHTSTDQEPHFVLLADPFSFPAERLVQGLDYAFASSVKTGGLASGGQQGGNVLYLGRTGHHSGAVGIALQGNIIVDTIVAQGCRPVGRLMRVTRCHRNLLLELDEQPAVEALQELFTSLNEGDQDLARHSLFLGMAMDELRDEFDLGDFLIRNILGMDPTTGALAIGELLKEGQRVQFHLRDARTSGEELDGLLERYAADRLGGPDWGTLLFSCLGRGQYLYGRPDYDTDLFRKRLGGIPLGGFFCNGEIGPVGDTTFLHGYTSSFGVFRPRSA